MGPHALRDKRESFALAILVGLVAKEGQRQGLVKAAFNLAEEAMRESAERPLPAMPEEPEEG